MATNAESTRPGAVETPKDETDLRLASEEKRRALSGERVEVRRIVGARSVKVNGS